MFLTSKLGETGHYKTTKAKHKYRSKIDLRNSSVQSSSGCPTDISGHNKRLETLYTVSINKLGREVKINQKITPSTMMNNSSTFGK